MSELLQSGQFSGASGHHPDADQLSAFIEQALPAHEREQVLAHLAVCPDCRETVTLSLPQLETPPVADAARRSAPRSAPRSWTRGWSIFVPAALALAASVFFVVHVRQTSMKGSIPAQPAQIAATQPPLHIAPPAAPTPSLAPREDRARTANLVEAPAPLANRVESRQLDALAVAPQAAPAAPAVVATKNGNAALESTQSLAGRLTAPAPAVAPLPPTTSAPSGSVTQAVDVASEPPLLNTSSASLELRVAPPAPHAVVMNHPLPSGFAALSAAANGRAILAIDTHNTVFLSNDSGEHWAAVPATWHGHAVNVNLISHGVGFAPAAGAAHGANIATFAGAARLSSVANASLAGVVTDASRAVIPGATVTIRDAATSESCTVATDANGHYLADNLIPGNYNIEATAPGFVTQHMDDLALQASRQTAENFTLQVGSVSETVSVEAETQPMASPHAAKSKALKSSPAIAPPQPIFEITTDTGEHWTSTDGIAWQHE